MGAASALSIVWDASLDFYAHTSETILITPNNSRKSNGTDMSESQRIVRRKLSDEVFDRLRAMITDGELAPGDPLPSERDLMERFGVGRPAVREAMQTLSNMSLITITHGERAKVRQINAKALFGQLDAAAHILLSASPESLEHLKSARMFFERGMVREAATRATAEDIARLRQILDEQRAAKSIARDFIKADAKFHAAIAAVSGNPIFEAVSEAMLNWLQVYRTDMLLFAGKEAVTLAEHDTIIKHIEAHDADMAEEAMIAHLNRSSALYAHHAYATPI
jgi:DNA-binding FadR family transcriptional regulator